MTYDPSHLPSTDPGMTDPMPPQPNRRWWQSRWLVTLVALAAGLGIGAAARGGGSTRTVAGPTVTRTATATVPGPTVTATATRAVTATRTLTTTKTVTPQPSTTFGDGTYVVGTDIQPGRYKTDGKGETSLGCYWARDGDLSGDDILANGIINGPTTVEVRSGDTAFEVSGGCQWAKVG